MHNPETKICLHLLPFLTQLKEQGSAITETFEDAWSNCRLNLILDSGPTITRANEIFELPPTIKLWHNDDPHYAIENGLFCKLCKHSVSWPRRLSGRKNSGETLLY